MHINKKFNFTFVHDKSTFNRNDRYYYDLFSAIPISERLFFSTFILYQFNEFNKNTCTCIKNLCMMWSKSIIYYTCTCTNVIFRSTLYMYTVNWGYSCRWTTSIYKLRYSYFTIQIIDRNFPENLNIRQHSNI